MRRYLDLLQEQVTYKIITHTVSGVPPPRFSLFHTCPDFWLLLACDTTVTVSISFGSKVWTISPADFRIATLSNKQCLGAFFALTTGSSAPPWIIGDTFLVSCLSSLLYAVFIHACGLTEERLHCLPLLAPFYRFCPVVVHSNSTKRRERVCSYSYDWLRVNGLCYLCSQVRERFKIIWASGVNGKSDLRCACLGVGCAEYIHGALIIMRNVQCFTCCVTMFYRMSKDSARIGTSMIL